MILDNKTTLFVVLAAHCALFYGLLNMQRPSAPAEPVFMQAIPLAMGETQPQPQVQAPKPIPQVKQKIKEMRQKVQERVARTQPVKAAPTQAETPERAATMEVAAAKTVSQRDETQRVEPKSSSSNDSVATPSGGQEGLTKQVEQAVSAPSFHANYLSNPKPAYPPASLALGEQGTVYLRVLVSPAGTPEKIDLQKSSGFARLDAVAQSTVQRWRFVPAKRGDEAVAGSVVVPVNFSIKKS